MKIGKFDSSKCFDYENGFLLTSEAYRMGNILSHYELYKKIVDLPGDIIELGVFKGSSFIQFCTFRELLENEKSRKIIGFDVFGDFPDVSAFQSDIEFVEKWNTQFQNDYLSQEDLEVSLKNKGFHNFELVKGNILQTVDSYLDQHPYTRIALLHIDVDVYEPALAGLQKLYDRIVPGGLIMLDDYATVEGETHAVDEFFQSKPVKIQKLRISHAKPSFIIKE